MARPREFDEREALERAMRVFWAKGYEAASLGDLTRAMRLGKSSFYGTFGSKHELFLSAITHYEDTVLARLIAGLEGEGSARAAIAAVFEQIVESVTTGACRRGCFLGNCATEVSPHDSEAAARVSAGLARLEKAFEEAVARGQAAGEISTRLKPLALARYLASSSNGLRLMAKADPDLEALKDVARIVLLALE